MSFFDFFKKKHVQSDAMHQQSKNAADIAGITDQMLNDLALAEDIYSNNPSWLNVEDSPLAGSGIGALVASEIARLVTIESSITVSDSEINDVIQKYVISNIRVEIEKGWALGGLIFKPYYNNAIFELAQGKVIKINGKLKVDFIYPSQFLIDDYDNSGAIHRIRFFSTAVQNQKYYTRVEEQDYDEITRELVITNTVYETMTSPTRYKWDNLGTKTVPLNIIERWRDIQPKMVFTNVDGTLVGFFKPALANNSDINSPYGLSGLVRAKNAIERADKIYNNLEWEMDASLARLYVDETAIPTPGSIPKKLSKFIVRLLGSGDKKIFEKFTPEIREQNYLNMWNANLRHIEDIIGLAHGTLSNADDVAKTATEIAVMKQRSYATVTDNQKALKTAIEQLVYAMQVWTNPTKVAEKLEVAFDFDDSIISNPNEQLAQYLLLQDAGNIPAYKTNMMYFGSSEKDAKALAAEGKSEIFNNMTDNAEADTE